MTDIHSHLLYDFDDGAADADMCRRMLEAYAGGGVKTVAASSHSVAAGQKSYEAAFAAAASEAEKFGITLKKAHEYTVSDLLADPEYPLGEGRFFLLDPAGFSIDSGLFNRLMPLTGSGKSILWAHPERLYGIRAAETVERFAVLPGSVCQLNAGSLLGAYGRKTADAAWKLLEKGLVCAIASDAHDEAGVKNFIKARQLVEKFFPPETADMWFEENPRRILCGENPRRFIPPEISFFRKIKRDFF